MKVSHFIISVLVYFTTFVSSSFAYDVTFKNTDTEIRGAHDPKFFKRFPGSVIFDYSHEKVKEYSLLLGSIQFEEGQDFESSGFRANKIETLKGEVTRVVYDYPETVSLDSVMLSIQNRLELNGFTNRYTCRKEDCGSAVGWETYLYPKLGTNDLNQQYIVANKSATTVVFYITDIAGQARGILDIIEVANNLNSAKADLDSAKVFFKTGRYDVDLKQLNNLESLVEIALKTNQTLLIKGYADVSGDQNNNKILSTQRANQVKSLLSEKFNFPSEKIEAIGLGEVYIDNRNSDEHVLPTDRRVEVILQTAS